MSAAVGPGGRAAGGAGTADPGAVLAVVTSQPWYEGQVGQVLELPGTAAVHAEPAQPLAAPFARFLDRRGLRLYAHQARTLDAWRSGADVVLATPTSSGKSLAFNACAVEALLADARATALYLYPTKALAQDQLPALAELDRELELEAAPGVYDGDTSGSARRRLRETSRLVVTNPWGLHEYLPQAHQWARFLSGLSLVVVDEAHRYRGVFGAHVALVLRRLDRLARRLGGSPRYLLASGTVANPGEHARALIGRPVTVIGPESDGAGHGPRAVAVFDAGAAPRQPLGRQAAAVVAVLADAGHRTLCFTGSRLLAELVAQWAVELARDARISPYRAGYRAGERRSIERALAAGELDAVVATNALELGIDIGGLDAVVLAGYPGTVASTWQQIGRAGRAGRPGLAVLVLGTDPVDAYIARRPQVVLDRAVERAVVATHNVAVLPGHLLCAAAEAPLTAGDVERFGPSAPEVVAALRAEGLLAPVPSGDTFAGAFRPASLVRLDGGTDGVVEVEVAGEVVEVLDPWRALQQAYPGAILLHRGQALEVRSLDLDAGRAEAVLADGTEHTRPSVLRRHQLGRSARQQRAGRWRLAVGPVRIETTVTGFRRWRGRTQVASETLDLPATVLDTRGLWLWPDDGLGAVAEAAAAAGCPPIAALHGAEHALIHALALCEVADRQDGGGLSTLADPGLGGPLILLHDGVAGGSGVVDAAADRFETVAGLALDMVERCDCDRGCPRCVYDRACGSGNADLDRVAAAAVLRSMLVARPERQLGPSDELRWTQRPR